MAENSRNIENMDQVFQNVKDIKQGDIVKAKVYRINEDDTIILTLPNQREATMHKDHYTHEEIQDLKSVLKEGDVIQVKVIKIEKEDDNNNIYVSRLSLVENTIYQDLEKIKENQETITTKIKESRENGLVLVYKNTELFIPNKLIDNKIVSNKEEYIGKELEVLVIDVKKHQSKTTVICSRLPLIKKEKELQAKLREEARQKALDSINTGDILNVEVVKILKNSIEVSINEYLNGQVRISQISHQHITNLEDVVKVGEKHKALVLEKQGKRIDLSIKALVKTPFELYVEENKEGSIVEAVIEKKLEKGYIVKLAENIQSFLSTYELVYNLRQISQLVLNPGDKVMVKILKVDLDEKKIYISKKQVEKNPWDNVNLSQGDEIEAVVVRKQANGSGLDVEFEKIPGFISKRDLKKPLEEYQTGEKILAFVFRVNPTKWDLVLTQRPITKKVVETQE